MAGVFGTATVVVCLILQIYLYFSNYKFPISWLTLRSLVSTVPGCCFFLVPLYILHKVLYYGFCCCLCKMKNENEKSELEEELKEELIVKKL